MTPIDDAMDDRALDSLSVAPTGEEKDQEAGQDRSIARRLQKHPDSKDAQLDNALDESMDASDPPSNTQPASGEPAPSSGYDADAERARGR